MPQQQHVFKQGQSLAPVKNQWSVKKQSNFEKVLWIIILLIPGGFLVWSIEQVLRLFLDYLSRSRPEIGAAIIAASGTIIVSVLSIVLTRWSERSKELDQKRREFDEKHREEYSQRCRKLLLGLINTFGSQDQEGENLKFLMSSEFQLETYMWASSELIKEIVGLIDVILEKGAEIAAITSTPGKTKGDLPREVYVALEKIIYRVRYEYGHEDKDLSEGDLIALSLGMKDIRPRKHHNLDWYTHMKTGVNLPIHSKREDAGEGDIVALYAKMLQRLAEDLKKSGDPQSPQMANGKQSPSDEATIPNAANSEKEDPLIPEVCAPDGMPDTPVVMPDIKPSSVPDADDLTRSNGS